MKTEVIGNVYNEETFTCHSFSRELKVGFGTFSWKRCLYANSLHLTTRVNIQPNTELYCSSLSIFFFCKITANWTRYLDTFAYSWRKYTQWQIYVAGSRKVISKLKHFSDCRLSREVYLSTTVIGLMFPMPEITVAIQWLCAISGWDDNNIMCVHSWLQRI